jgi:hypothetical protein
VERAHILSRNGRRLMAAGLTPTAIAGMLVIAVPHGNATPGRAVAVHFRADLFDIPRAPGRVVADPCCELWVRRGGGHVR